MFFFIFFGTLFPGTFSGTTMHTSIIYMPLEPLWSIDLTYGSLVDIVAHLGGQIPEKPPKNGSE